MTHILIFIYQAYKLYIQILNMEHDMISLEIEHIHKKEDSRIV